MYGESIGAITFDFSGLEGSMSRSLIFRKLISHNEAELGHELLLNTKDSAALRDISVQNLSDLVLTFQGRNVQ